MLAASEGTPLMIDERVRRAARRLAQADAEGALAIIAPFVEERPADLSARFVMAMTAWQLGRFDLALEELRRCHDASPMDGTVAEALASVYAQVGNLGESLFMGKLGTALGGIGVLGGLIPPGFPTFDRAFLTIQDQPLFAQARLLIGTGKLRAGLEKARQHVALNPGDDEARLFYAAALLRTGAAGAAAEVLGAAEDRSPAQLLALKGRALAAVGETEAARRAHDRAAAAAPEDAAIAGARLADAIWLDDDPGERGGAARAWSARFCAETAPQRRSLPAGKIVIGYLVCGLADPLDAVGLSAVAGAHDRSRVTTVAYGRGAQSWEENAPLSGPFDRWRDAAALDPATLARFIARDGVTLLVDASGFDAPEALLALARRPCPLRLAWLGAAANSCAPTCHDGAIGPGFGAGYPVPQAALPERRAADFGADVRLAQLDPATVRLWCALLDAMPDARLLLRANDMEPGPNIDRLIARFGRDRAARIDVLAALRAEEFYSRIGVALTPRRGVSPRAAAEAVAHGVPPVALGGGDPAEPYGRFLEALGLGPQLAAPDERDYLGIAMTLATSAGARERIDAALAAARANSAATPVAIAQAIEQRAAETVLEAAG
jgi:protein O-GlcNAc transferase